MWLIFIGVVMALVVIGVNCSKKSEQARENYKNNIPIIQETISKLKILEEYSHHPCVEEECGLVMVIPINEAGDLYFPHSDRLKISLLLYTRDMNTISFFEQQTEISTLFQLKDEDNSFNYINITYGRFHGTYKEFMLQLNAAVEEAFPNVKVEFDGSRVMVQHL